MKMTNSMFIAYYYHGMIYACIKQHDCVANFFENIVTVLATATLVIDIQKTMLMKWIPNSQLSNCPSRHIQQTMKSLCVASYTKLNSTLTQVDEFVNRHRE